MSYVRLQRPSQLSYHNPGLQLGEVCPPCAISIGTECIPCPPGAEETMPECEGCAGGRSPKASIWERSRFLAPVVIGVATTLAVTWIVSRYPRRTVARAA